MSSISGIAQHTTTEARSAAASIATLAERADALRGSVLRFTLPDETASPGTGTPDEQDAA